MRRAFSIGSWVVVCLMLGACAEELKNFTCSVDDISNFEGKIGRAPNSKNTDSSTYHTAVSAWNKKIAEKCSAKVLDACAKDSKEVKGNGDVIVGPVNAFGVNSSTELREVWEHDGFARHKGHRVYYNTTIDKEKFATTAKCFKENL